MTTTRKPCARCKNHLAPRGNRYCDPCERIVRDEMKRKNYLEDRHIPHANKERAARPTGAR